MALEDKHKSVWGGFGAHPVGMRLYFETLLHPQQGTSVIQPFAITVCVLFLQSGGRGTLFLPISLYEFSLFEVNECAGEEGRGGSILRETIHPVYFGPPRSFPPQSFSVDSDSETVTW